MKFESKRQAPGGLRRYEHNPILTADHFPDLVKGVYNSGVTKHGNSYIMLCRVEDRALRQHLWIARSSDGYTFTPDPAPLRLPSDPIYRQAIAGTLYDPRITFMDGWYYIVHAAADSQFNSRLAMIRTRDFEDFEFVSLPGSVNTRNGLLFPEKIKGLYVMMERDAGLSGGEMWLNYSPDMIHWGQAKRVYSRQAQYWHFCKVGAGAVPIRTEKGWLEIFHGVHVVCESQMVYSLGVMLLDLEDPSRVIASCPYAILSPETSYERTGMTPNVVFTCGACVENNGEVKIYYGGADTVQCLATTTLDHLLDACFMKPLAD